MSINDGDFFVENIVNVNKRVEQFFFASCIVPVIFIICSALDFWKVPHNFSIILIIYSIISALICHFLNKYPKTQKSAMYTGILLGSIYIFLMGFKGVINLTVAYAFTPFLSCLYYDKKLTFVTTMCSFVAVLIDYWVRSYTVAIVTAGVMTNVTWFFENVTGILIEFLFVYLIASSIAQRTSRTLKKFMKTVEERDEAYNNLKENNANIIKLNNDLEFTNQELAQTQYKIIQFVAQCLGSHDLFTGRHIIHTQKYVEVICKQLKESGHYVSELSDENIQNFQTAAFLHDLGKIHIPEGILNKIGKFTPDEFERMKSHPAEGKKLLEFLPKINDGKFNEIAQDMTYCHHEKWDGSGYPNGLRGLEIPLCARIMAAADVLDALISKRLYKEPMSIEEAMDVFNKSKGTHFEPCIAEAVIASSKLISIIDKDFKNEETATYAEEISWWQRYHENSKPV